MVKKIGEKRHKKVIETLGLKKHKSTGKKKLIIQIDGMAYDVLMKFFAEGGLRWMKSYIEKNNMQLHKWNCGISSGTPTVQAGIMYGKNNMIPGFRFLDKKTKRLYSFGNPNHAKKFENEVFKKDKGILEKGSSYSNIFSGGAHRSILTMSTITKNKNFRRIRESSLLLFLLLHPVSLLRVLYYSLTELFIEFLTLISYPFDKFIRKRHTIYGIWIPFRRFLMNSLMAELITLGVIIDIRRRVSKIYINYMNFDDIGHLRGPESNAAYFMARATERRIKRIIKRIKKYNNLNKDKYDVIIMSDHGQIPCIPFERIEGKSLAQFIQDAGHVESVGLSSAHEGRLSLIGVVMGKTLVFLNYVSTPLRVIGTAFAKAVVKSLKPKSNSFTWSNGEQIIVCDACAVAQVYFTSTKKRMNKKEIDKKYPELLGKLRISKGIGCIMVKENDKIKLLGRDGEVIIDIKTGRYLKKGKDFMKRFEQSEILIEQLKEYNTFKFIGDLVIFGNYEKGIGTSFTHHVGAHGGIGGNMTWPFIISDIDFDFTKVRNSRELYDVFK